MRKKVQFLRLDHIYILPEFLGFGSDCTHCSSEYPLYLIPASASTAEISHSKDGIPLIPPRTCFEVTSARGLSPFSFTTFNFSVCSLYSG